MTRDLTRFLLALGVVVGLTTAGLIALAVRLVVLGELPPGAPMGHGVGLRGTLFDDYAQYKLAETLDRKPEVLVLGSSRVMQFRASLFTGCAARSACFYNAGGALPSIQSGLAFLRGLDRGGQPKVLLLGIDLWQFNPAFDRLKHEIVVFDRSPTRSLDADLAVTRRFIGMAFRDAEIRAVIFGQVPTIPGTSGVVAITRGSGFRQDGSYDYGPSVTATTRNESPSARVAEVVSRVPAGCCRFERFEESDRASLVELDELLQLAAARGIQVIAFTPPFADAVVDALEADPVDRAGVTDVRQTLEAVFAKRGVPFRWAPSTSSVGCADDEVWDGSHASEVCDARLLAAILEDHSVAATLSSYADRNEVLKLVAGRRSALALGDER